MAYIMPASARLGGGKRTWFHHAPASTRTWHVCLGNLIGARVSEPASTVTTDLSLNRHDIGAQLGGPLGIQLNPSREQRHHLCVEGHRYITVVVRSPVDHAEFSPELWQPYRARRLYSPATMSHLPRQTTRHVRRQPLDRCP